MLASSGPNFHDNRVLTLLSPHLRPCDHACRHFNWWSQPIRPSQLTACLFWHSKENSPIRQRVTRDRRRRLIKEPRSMSSSRSQNQLLDRSCFEKAQPNKSPDWTDARPTQPANRFSCRVEDLHRHECEKTLLASQPSRARCHPHALRTRVTCRRSSASLRVPEKNGLGDDALALPDTEFG